MKNYTYVFCLFYVFFDLLHTFSRTLVDSEDDAGDTAAARFRIPHCLDIIGHVKQTNKPNE